MERFNLASPIKINEIACDSASSLNTSIQGIASLEFSEAGDLCFCDRLPKADSKFGSAGSVILCTHELHASLLALYPAASFVPMSDPRAAFIDLGTRLLSEGHVAVSSAVPRPFGVHPSVQVEAGSVIHAETRIDKDVKIGSNCVIHRGTWIKAGAEIHDNSTIGVEGINAYKGNDAKQRSFPHFASVIIGENVEIGAGSVVVRGILNSTLIGSHTVIGNLCNIGHVVEIGEKVWMSVGCLIGGHSHIGNGATLGMGVAIKDNIQIGENAQIGMGSVVVKSVKPNSSVFGNPARAIGPIQAGPVR
jgi:UDP-3-O-[3-hydroxymyristoyl] glucosamine N-acyltransferase